MAIAKTYRVVIRLGEHGTETIRVKGCALVQEGTLAFLEGAMGTPLVAAFAPSHWLSCREEQVP